MNIFAVCALRCAGRSGCELAGEPPFTRPAATAAAGPAGPRSGFCSGSSRPQCACRSPLRAGPEIYWANDSNSTIGRASIDGANRDESFISTGTDGPADVFVYGQHIYWATATGGCSESGACNGTIAVANLNGTDSNKDLVSAVPP